MADQTGRPLSATPLLVGRDREQATLRVALDAARDGRGSLVLIGGEAGIGKTALAEVLLAEAGAQGALVLVGRCYDLTETPPYGPWVELFGRYRQADEMPPLPDAFAVRGTVGEVTSQAALFQQVLDFLAALAAARPVLVLLDDLHWADASSLDLLRFVARQLGALPLLLVVAYRSDELTRRHPLSPLLPALVREAAAERVDLRPLDDAAVRALIAGRHRLAAPDADRLVAFVQGRAEGNALFTGEVLRSLVESDALRREGDLWYLSDLSQAALPPLLGQVIDARVSRLDGEGQRLLALAAAVGQEAALAVLGPLAGMDEEALLAAVEGAAAAGLLAEAPDGLHVRFAHALVREAVYTGISPARRRLLHRRIGELLAARSHPDPDAVAMHFQRATDGRAVPWLVRAGERAQLAYAWLTAIERYEMALAVLEGGEEDLAQQGWLRYRIGRLRRYRTPEQGIEYLDEAQRVAAVVGDRALAAAARYTRGLCLFYTGDYEMAIRAMSAGCDALETLPPVEQERLDLGPDEQGTPTATNPRGLLVLTLALTGRIAAAVAMGEATREGVPRHTPLGELGWAHHGDRPGGLAEAYALAGRPDVAREAFERARDIYRALGNHSTLGAVTGQELIVISLPYRTERTDEHWTLAKEAADATGRAITTGERSLRFASIPLLMLVGRWSEARAESDTALRGGMPGTFRWNVHLILGELARARGEPEVARAYLRELLPAGPQTAPGGLPFLVGIALLGLASALCLDAGELGNAKVWLDAYDRWLAWSGAVLGRSEGQALWAQYHRQAGDVKQADERAERSLAHASDPRQPRALIAAHRQLGELDTEAERYEEAANHLDQSLALADACGAPYERALTLLAIAELRAATGTSDEARRRLAEARAICERLGAKPVLARADALAARLDVTPPAAPSYPAGLSAREAEVLRLIAQGLTNRQVAEQLFLSPRTVGQHLRSIYNKLGVDNRTAAARFATDHGVA